MAFVVNNYVYAKYHLDHHPNDVLWCTADIGWLTMHIWGIVGALANGVTTIVFEGALDYPTPDRFYQIVERYRVNKIFTAPTAIRMLMRYGDERDDAVRSVVARCRRRGRRAAQPRGVALDVREARQGAHLRQQHLGPDRALRLSACRRGVADAHEARFLRDVVSRRRGRRRGRLRPHGPAPTSSATSSSGGRFR